MSFQRLDEVTVFDGKLTFLIPHEWVENETDADEGTYLYHLPKAQSGFFRASLVSVNGVADPLSRLDGISAEWQGRYKHEQTGNIVSTFEKDIVQDGNALHLYYWFVANVVLPDAVREAIFSYTVDACEVRKSETQADVRILAQVVGMARFG